MDIIDSKFRVFDNINLKEETYDKVKRIYILFEIFYQSLVNDAFSYIDEFYIILLNYYLENFISPYKAWDIEDDTYYLLSIINLYIFDSFVCVISQKVTYLLERVVTFENLYHFVRLYGHSEEIPNFNDIIKTFILILENIKSPHMSSSINCKINKFCELLYNESRDESIKCDIMDMVFVFEKIIVDVSCPQIIDYQLIHSYVGFAEKYLMYPDENVDHILESVSKTICSYGPNAISIVLSECMNLKDYLINHHEYSHKFTNSHTSNEKDIKSSQSDSKFNENINLVLSIFPNISSQVISKMLTICPDPQIVISNIIDNPDYTQSFTTNNNCVKKGSIVKTRIPSPITVIDNSFKNINLHLVQQQDIHEAKTFEMIKENLLKTSENSWQDIEYNDDYDELEQNMNDLKITSAELVDELLSQDSELVLNNMDIDLCEELNNINFKNDKQIPNSTNNFHPNSRGKSHRKTRGRHH